MPRAIWNGQVVAETDDFEVVEGNVYFPPSSIRSEFFTPAEEHTTFPWKGVASYYDVTVDGKTSAGGAWYYPEPKSHPQAMKIKDYVAFWRGVEVER